jgi:hypothetical protein
VHSRWNPELTSSISKTVLLLQRLVIYQKRIQCDRLLCTMSAPDKVGEAFVGVGVTGASRRLALVVEQVAELLIHETLGILDAWIPNASEVELVVDGSHAYALE